MSARQKAFEWLLLYLERSINQLLKQFWCWNISKTKLDIHKLFNPTFKTNLLVRYNVEFSKIFKEILA